MSFEVEKFLVLSPFYEFFNFGVCDFGVKLLLIGITIYFEFSKDEK